MFKINQKSILLLIIILIDSFICQTVENELLVFEEHHNDEEISIEMQRLIYFLIHLFPNFNYVFFL